jgi:hypothetical protein
MYSTTIYYRKNQKQKLSIGNFCKFSEKLACYKDAGAGSARGEDM